MTEDAQQGQRREAGREMCPSVGLSHSVHLSPSFNNLTTYHPALRPNLSSRRPPPLPPPNLQISALTSKWRQNFGMWNPAKRERGSRLSPSLSFSYALKLSMQLCYFCSYSLSLSSLSFLPHLLFLSLDAAGGESDARRGKQSCQ